MLKLFFYSTQGNCVDLLPGTCLHIKNVLSCKNRCVSELCRDTCNNCTPGTYNYYIYLKPKKYLSKKL